MLDPGRYLAEAIYFLQYTLAQLLWLIDRALLAIAVIAEGINSWITDNVGYFVQLMVNGLSAPLGGLFILALTALGFWYALNNVVPTGRWVDPGRLLLYGALAFFFFSAPVLIIDRMEALRATLNANLDPALLAGADGSVFAAGMDGTDPGLPPALPDVNSDGVIASFDMAAAFLLVANLDELDSSEFPVDFEAAYFPFGDPAGIDLTDEADQELAKALASDGLERLLFAWIAVPTAIAEHFLRLALTGVAVLLYLGVPIAMLFAFFIYTQAFLVAYLRQFLNLLIETFLTMIITSVMLMLLAAAALEGLGLYLAASLIALFVLAWRLKSALKLGGAALDLFGGAMLTGGVGGRELATMGAQAVAGTVAAAGAMATGGVSLAVGGAALAAAGVVRADGQAGGAYLGSDPDKAEVRARQLQTIAGYSLGRSTTVRGLIENVHETRTLARNFRDGTVSEGEPDLLDYLRAGSAMSGFGSSPWLAMRMSPSLRGAFDQIGGRRYGYGLLAESFDDEEDGAPVGRPRPVGAMRRAYTPSREQAEADEWGERPQPVPDWLQEGLPQASNRPATGAPAGTRFQAEEWSESSGAIPPWLREAVAEMTPRAYPRQPADSRTNDDGWPEENNGDRTAERLAQGSPVTSGPPAGNRTASNLDDNWPEDIDATGSGEPAGSSSPRVPTTPDIHLETLDDERRRLLPWLLDHLTSPDSHRQNAARQTLVQFTGEANARQIDAAVGAHSAAAVAEAATAIDSLLATYRQEGAANSDILTAFRTGEATTRLREELAAADTPTPLADSALHALADLVMMPQRRLGRAEFVRLVGEEVAAGERSEEALAARMGSPVGFGGHTGVVRGVMAGTSGVRFPPSDLERLAELLRQGLWLEAQTELTAQGHRPGLVNEFLSDLAALPSVIIVPQTTAVPLSPASPAEEEEG